jgi:hypothetical protein
VAAPRGHKPLTPHQHQAAALIGRGAQKKDVAEEVGVSANTVSSWLKREDFRALAQERREAVLDENPTARATLEAALTATRTDGSPDFKVRVAAARALIAVDGPGEKPPKVPRETEFFDEPDGSDDPA